MFLDWIDGWDGGDDNDGTEVLLGTIGDGDDGNKDGGDVFGGVIRIPRKNPYLVLIWRGDKVLSNIDDNGDEDANIDGGDDNVDGDKDKTDERDDNIDVMSCWIITDEKNDKKKNNILFSFVLTILKSLLFLILS